MSIHIQILFGYICAAMSESFGKESDGSVGGGYLRPLPYWRLVARLACHAQQSSREPLLNEGEIELLRGDLASFLTKQKCSCKQTLHVDSQLRSIC